MVESFRKLGISEEIIKAIKDEKFEKPSEIQEKTIPLVLQGRDVIAGSATGSGKTLAFGAGIIQICEKGAGIQALILTPTRELAEQIARELKKFSKYKPLKIASVYGGLSIGPQIEELKSADIVIGTPGRILDHIERRTVEFDKLKFLVLDEADRMLDMGFIDDVEKIINECPNKRQTLLFSATISSDIARLIQRHIKEPVEVAVEQYVDPSLLTQIYYDVEDSLKFSLLVHLLKNEQSKLVMVFCNTRKNVDFVTKNLYFAGIEALAIHGGFSQDKRSRIMQKFKAEKALVLVCTDVAARGLDIKGISHVYNYDIPKDSKEYVHRIGRTARAGKEGKAVSLLASRDYENFTRVLRDNEVDVKSEEVPKVERVRIRWMEDRKSYRGGYHQGHSRGGERHNPRGGREGGDERRDSRPRSRSWGGPSRSRNFGRR